MISLESQNRLVIFILIVLYVVFIHESVIIAGRFSDLMNLQFSYRVKLSQIPQLDSLVFRTRAYLMRIRAIIQGNYTLMMTNKPTDRFTRLSEHSFIPNLNDIVISTCYYNIRIVCWFYWVYILTIIFA